MKKSFTALTVLLAASLTVTAAGCSSGGKNLAVLSSNWYTGTTFYGYQPEICEGREEIVYTIKHEQPEEAYANSAYTVKYADGTYKTEFRAATFDASGFPESYLEDFEKAGKFTAYCYKTTLEIPKVTFTLKSDADNPKDFENQKIKTESWFLSVNDYLRPLYSKQVVNSVTPWSLKPKKLEEGDAYKTFDLSYENFYSFDGKSVTTVLTEGGEKQTTETTKLNKSKNSLFDPFTQDIVVRASDLYSGGSLSQAVSFYIPKSGKTENFVLTGYDNNVQFSSDEQKNAVIDELIDAGLYEGDKTAENRTLKTVAVTVSYTSGSQPGGTQSYWFTAVKDKRNNMGRATLLKMTSPLSYYQGTLIYTLDMITSSLNK